MNKKLLVVTIGILVVIFLAIGYVVLRPTENTATESSISSEEIKNASQPLESPDEQPVNSRSGTYIDYSDTVIAQTSGTKILFFHAPWCSQCRAVEASIDDKGIPSNVTVIKVDYDSHQDLRKKYGVTLQTTFVKVDDQGNKIDSYVAYEQPDIESVESALLK